MKYIFLSISLLLSCAHTHTHKSITSKKISRTHNTPTAEISYGELVDKITILEIKTEKISDLNKLRNIWNELETLMNTYYQYAPQTKEIDQLKKALKVINEKLWNIENDIRAKDAANEFDDEFIALARAVYVTNDERGALKRAINELCGSRLVEEKQYTKYNTTL